MLAYAIKSAIFLSIMYIPYMLMLRKESFFHFNRVLLISIMLLSLVLPLCDFHTLSIENNPIQHGMIVFGTPAAIVGNADNVATTEETNWFVVAFYIYIIGVAATFIWKMLQLTSLYATICNCVLWKDEQDGITVYCHAQDIAPFSWLKTIVISEDDYNNNATEILRHELGHIQHHHSFDIILANIIQTIQWWNPLAWIIASSLRDVHEYEADHVVLTSGVNIRQYQTLLIRKAVANTNYTFANSFNHSLLKKRITMMVKAKSNPWMRTKALFLIPMAAIALCAFATPELHKQVNKIVEKAQKAEQKSINLFTRNENLPPMKPAEDKELKKVFDLYESERLKEIKAPKPSGPEEYIYGPGCDNADVFPEFPGGREAYDKFLKENIKYPEEAKAKGIHGNVICSYMLENDGSISNIQVIQSEDPSLGKEVTRVLSLMPNWIPAKKDGKNVRIQCTTVLYI